MTNRAQVFHSSERGTPFLSAKFPYLRQLPSCHAEQALLEFYIRKKRGIGKSTHLVSVAYITKEVNGRLMCVLTMAKPCKSCAFLMHYAGVKKCTYSTSLGFVTEQMATILTSAKASKGAMIPVVHRDRSLLKNALLRTMFELYVQSERTFTLIDEGRKTVEGRLWAGAIRTLHIGDVIWIVRDGVRIPVQITFMRRYSSFHAMLSYKDTLTRALPEEVSVMTGVQKYNALYEKKKNVNKCVVAIGLLKLTLRC
jgi:ASC-1-like (ASCH) protein